MVVTITITGLNEQKNLFSLAASIQETEEEKTDSANNENGGWTGGQKRDKQLHADWHLWIGKLNMD